jgi:hypothetical protein
MDLRLPSIRVYHIIIPGLEPASNLHKMEREESREDTSHESSSHPVFALLLILCCTNPPTNCLPIKEERTTQPTNEKKNTREEKKKIAHSVGLFHFISRPLKSSMPTLSPRKWLLLQLHPAAPFWRPRLQPKQSPPPWPAWSTSRLTTTGLSSWSSSWWQGGLMQRSRLRSGHLGGLSCCCGASAASLSCCCGGGG